MTRVWLAAMVLAACGGRARHASDEVRVQIPVEPPHLDPLLAADALSVRLTLGDVYETLPVLAKSLTWSADQRELTVVVRDDVTWHDGAPFGAGDVVATFQKVAPGGVATPLAVDFDDLEGVEKVGEQGVRVRFRGFRVGREDAIAHLPILPAHVGLDALARAPVGTGPYRFDGWDAGVEIRLVRNEQYWGAKPALVRVRYRVVRDPTQAMAQLRAGELDVLPQTSGTLVASLTPKDDVRVVPYDAPSYTAVIWNCRQMRGALVDPKVRRALGMMLDRETIAREIYKGHARLISGPWEPGAPASDPAVKPLPFDIARARALVAGHIVEIKLLLPREVPGLEKVATIWQDDAARAGVKIELEPVPWDQLLARAKAGDFDGVMLSMTTSPEQDEYANLHSGAELNYGAFDDPLVDHLVEQIRETADRAARIELEHQLHRKLHDAQPMTFVTADVRIAAVAGWLGKVGIDGSGMNVRVWQGLIH